MPMGRTVARLNRVGLNRVSRHIAPWLPGFAVVIHRGRKTGRTFRTPVNVFLREGRYVFALTYGPEADWVRNVLAAGGCQLHYRRRVVHLTAPVLQHDEHRSDLPLFVRTVLRLTKVHEYLLLQEVS
jgi:deazaflavin-dependent oxidoreductase (nitroreductase family)